MTREIPLTKGQVALVDDEDYEALAAYRWTALWSKLNDLDEGNPT